MTCSSHSGAPRRTRDSVQTIANTAASQTNTFEPGRAGLLISIQSRYADAILSGTKTVELRRRPPRSHPPVAVIYGSGVDRSVLGTASIEAIHTGTPAEIWEAFSAVAGVTRDEFDAYFADSDDASALELAAPRRAAEALPLDELRAMGLEPPQSWRYVDSDQLGVILSAMHPALAGASAPVPIARHGDSGQERGNSALYPFELAWKGVKPIAALGLRCMALGQRVGPRSENQAGERQIS